MAPKADGLTVIIHVDLPEKPPGADQRETSGAYTVTNGLSVRDGRLCDLSARRAWPQRRVLHRDAILSYAVALEWLAGLRNAQPAEEAKMTMPKHLRRGHLWQLASRTGHDTGRPRPVLRRAYERAVALETTCCGCPNYIPRL